MFVNKIKLRTYAFQPRHTKILLKYKINGNENII